MIQRLLLLTGSAIIAYVVAVGMTLITDSPFLGVVFGGAAAFSLGWSASKDGLV